VRQDHEQSLAERVAKLPPAERAAIAAELTQAGCAALEFDWSFWGRPEQIAPPGTWDNWLILAGRGFGKTRTGAEWVRANMCGDELAKWQYAQDTWDQLQFGLGLGDNPQTCISKCCGRPSSG
jgi:phage terminase large subunit-like protein